MVVNITSGHPTSLIPALPNIHYPIPASFELTQRVPTDWVCGATNDMQNTEEARQPSLNAEWNSPAFKHLCLLRVDTSVSLDAKLVVVQKLATQPFQREQSRLIEVGIEAWTEGNGS